jgi:hypothetical protein
MPPCAAKGAWPAGSIALTLALQQNFTPKQTARIHRSLRDFAKDVRKEIGLEHHS